MMDIPFCKNRAGSCSKGRDGPTQKSLIGPKYILHLEAPGVRLEIDTVEEFNLGRLILGINLPSGRKQLYIAQSGTTRFKVYFQ